MNGFGIPRGTLRKAYCVRGAAEDVDDRDGVQERLACEDVPAPR